MFEDPFGSVPLLHCFIAERSQAFYGQRDTMDFFQCFPDASAQFHDFRVDPFEPNRVWWTVRGNGTHTGQATPGGVHLSPFRYQKKKVENLQLGMWMSIHIES